MLLDNFELSTYVWQSPLKLCGYSFLDLATSLYTVDMCEQEAAKEHAMAAITSVHWIPRAFLEGSRFYCCLQTILDLFSVHFNETQLASNK